MRAAYLRGSVLAVTMLAGCFAGAAGQLSDDPDAQWIPGLPIANSFAGIIEFESDPSGAEVTTSLGGTCRTPCSIEISAEGPFTATFTHEGYMTTTAQVKIQHAKMGVSERKFAPNPVVARLLPEAKPEPPPPPPKPAARMQPNRAAPKKPVASAHPTPAQPEKPAAAIPTQAQPEKPGAPTPMQAPPSKPAEATQPPQAPAMQPAPTPPAKPAVATQPAPAAPAWPTEVKPVPGINAGRIVPAETSRSGDNAVARRWLENSDKPAKDQ